MGVSLTERIAATNPGKPRTVDVDVSLDADLSDRREALEAELAAAKADTDRRQGQVDPAIEVQARIDELEAQESGSLLTLRFTKLDGLHWAEVSGDHPPRVGNTLDRTLGYNVDKTSIAAAERSGVIVEADGTETPVIVKPAVRDERGKIVEPAVNEWAGLWAALSGWDVRRVIEAVFDLNVGAAAGRMARLKKASEAANA